MFHMKIKILMCLRCQNHLIKNTPQIQMGGQGSPQIQPNDSSNLYTPYMGLEPTCILKRYFIWAIHV